MKKIKVIREKTGEEVMNDRMDVIGQNGNEGLHYEEESITPANNKSKMSKLLNLKQRILQRGGSNMDKNLSQVDIKINNLREEEIKTSK